MRASRVFDLGVALGKHLAFSIRSAEDVVLRHHHIVEVLGEHRGREESDCAQFVADIRLRWTVTEGLQRVARPYALAGDW